MFGKPTGINNVETLINVLEILRDRRAGVRGDRHRRLHRAAAVLRQRDGGAAGSLRGGVRGDARELLDARRRDPHGRPPQAILLGGAAGGFVTPDELDIELTFEDARAGGYTLGSGVVMVFNESVDLVDIVLRIARFFRDESCGQCVPCRVGTVRQEEALHRLVAGPAIGSREQEVALIDEIAQVDARRLDLRPGPDGRQRRAVGGATTSICSTIEGARA